MIQLFGIYTRELKPGTKKDLHKKDLYKDVHSSINHNSENTETTQKSVNG